jgi:hypothetical protein
LLISSVVADACNFRVAAVKEVTTPALETRVVLPAMPADTNALSLFPSDDLDAQFIDDAGNFVVQEPADTEFPATGLLSQTSRCGRHHRPAP